MAKESSEGEFLKKKCWSQQEKDWKFIQGKRCQGKGDSFRSAWVFTNLSLAYSELLIWMLHRLTDHSYFDRFENIHSSFFFGKLKTFVFYQCIIDLRIIYFFFFFMLNKSSDLQHMDLPRTGSYMGSADT